MKGDSFEGGIRVPGIAYWPGKIKAGSKSRELVHISDWYPTFAEIAGIDVEKERLDGLSAWSILKGDKGKRDVIPIISAARHALVTSNFSLVGTGENYQRLINNGLSNFRLYNLRDDISQKEPTESYPEISKDMQKQLSDQLQKVNRGYFNWDIKYAKYRLENKKGDHSFDFVINDQPELDVSYKGNLTIVTISPVSDKLAYKLQGSTDGLTWKDLDEYNCKKDAEKYDFTSFNSDKKLKEYRVLTDYHFGLPLHDGFSLEEAYKTGTLYSKSASANLVKFMPVVDGFLPVADISGGDQVQITGDNLVYGNWPSEGGALQMKLRNQENSPSVTRYFIEPHSQGKLYASMLVQFEASEAECIGEINWLVQNGWNGPTEKQVSLSFQNDGIYFNQSDPVKPYQDSWLAEHDKKVVCVVFEFELGTIGKDILKVYINPGKAETLIPMATYNGEFTFDRLQFNLTGRAGGKMIIDEIHVGRKLEEVLY
jgi:hypothetical protein